MENFRKFRLKNITITIVVKEREDTKTIKWLQVGFWIHLGLSLILLMFSYVDVVSLLRVAYTFASTCLFAYVFIMKPGFKSTVLLLLLHYGICTIEYFHLGLPDGQSLGILKWEWGRYSFLMNLMLLILPLLYAGLRLIVGIPVIIGKVYQKH